MSPEQQDSVPQQPQYPQTPPTPLRDDPVEQIRFAGQKSETLEGGSMPNPEYDLKEGKDGPIARRVTPRITCFELLKGLRNFAAMWRDMLIDNVSDIVLGEAGPLAVGACAIDVRECNRALALARETLRDCVNAGNIGPEVQRLFNQQFDLIERTLNEANQELRDFLNKNP
jgi:hypothetical protein